MTEKMTLEEIGKRLVELEREKAHLLGLWKELQKARVGVEIPIVKCVSQTQQTKRHKQKNDWFSKLGFDTPKT